MVHAARSDVARGDRVDTHATRRPFDGCGLGEAHHAHAGRTAVTHARHRAPHVRDDVDDRTAVRLHALSITFARNEESAREVGVEHRTPAFGADRLERRDVLPARIVHERIDPTVRGKDRANHRRHRRLVTDVARLRRGTAAVFGDLFSHTLELARITADQHHHRAEMRQFMRGAAPDARAATGHNHDPAFEQAIAEHGTVPGGFRQR